MIIRSYGYKPTLSKAQAIEILATKFNLNVDKQYLVVKQGLKTLVQIEHGHFNGPDWDLWDFGVGLYIDLINHTGTGDLGFQIYDVSQFLDQCINDGLVKPI